MFIVIRRALAVMAGPFSYVDRHWSASMRGVGGSIAKFPPLGIRQEPAKSNVNFDSWIFVGLETGIFGTGLGGRAYRTHSAVYPM